MSGVKIESLYNTSSTWLLSATFNDSAIIHELQSYFDNKLGFEEACGMIDYIQDECQTCDVFDNSIRDYCVEIRSIMNNMLCGTTYVPGDDAKDAMNDAWGELVEIVEGLDNKIKNKIYKWQKIYIDDESQDETIEDLEKKLNEISDIVCATPLIGLKYAAPLQDIQDIINS